MLFSFFVALVSCFASEPTGQTTDWKVEGAGWLTNRQLNRQLQAILPADEMLGSNDVEDAAIILLSLMQQKGYLDAKVVTALSGYEYSSGEWNESEGIEMEVTWDRSLETYLQLRLKLKTVKFDVRPGPVFFYETLSIVEDGGLEKEFIQSFYYKPPMLFQGDKVKIFNEGRFQKSCANLESYLAKVGYRDAVVEGDVVSMDMESGAVEVTVKVKKGRLHFLDSVHVANTNVDLGSVIDFSLWEGQPYSKEVKQDILKTVRNAYFAKGYPQVKLQETLESNEVDGKVLHQLDIKVSSGVQVDIGAIAINGLRLTHESFVRKKLNLVPGDPLNPILLDENRLRLSQTGLFDNLKISLEPEGERWDVNVDLRERFPWTWDLFVGWGSYEQLRMGTSVRRDNLWGQAHQWAVKGVASFKSLYGDAIYTIPDVRRSGVNLMQRSFYLDREENSFDRKERGVELGLSKRFERLDLDTSLLYTFEKLQSIDRQSREAFADENSSVGSFALRLTQDKRDSPITPKDGYRMHGTLEWAEPEFGGDVSYLSEEIGFAQHGTFGGGLFWHAGVSQGFVFTPEGQENFIPTNKLFFPGGDDSIRGYQRGEAAPLDEDGFFVGARSYVLANLELEQYVSNRISVVFFYDYLLTSRQSSLSTVGDSLQSIGLGIRWDTVIGPVRLEYGHNLSPRELDPAGTFHLAIGFPF